MNRSRAILFPQSDLFGTDVTSGCTTPKADEEAIKNAFGFTIDLKTGVYAFINLAGFYIDTSWIGNKMPGSDFSGLYWGIKNLVAKCTDCGNSSCVSQPFNDLFDSAKKALGMDGKKFRLLELTDSEHVSKGHDISSLDDQHIEGEEMPTGDVDNVCFLEKKEKAPPPKYRRSLFGRDDNDDKEKKPDPCQKMNKAPP